MENFNIEPIYISQQVINNLQESFDKETRDEIAKSFLKIISEKIGIDYIADCITNHPNSGYFVRYLDDFAPKMVARQHRENLDANIQKIKNILS